MCLADLEEVGGFYPVDLPVVKLLEKVLEKGAGQAFGQLFFSQFSMAAECPLVEGLRRPPLRSGLLSPSTKGQISEPKHLSPFELPAFSFCSRPNNPMKFAISCRELLLASRVLQAVQQQLKDFP